MPVYNVARTMQGDGYSARSTVEADSPRAAAESVAKLILAPDSEFHDGVLTFDENYPANGCLFAKIDVTEFDDGYPDAVYVRFDSALGRLGRYIECEKTDPGAIELYDDGSGMNVTSGAFVEDEMLESFDRSSIGLRKYLDTLLELANDLFAASDALLDAYPIVSDRPDEIGERAANRTDLANAVLSARFHLAQVC